MIDAKLDESKQKERRGGKMLQKNRETLTDSVGGPG